MKPLHLILAALALSGEFAASAQSNVRAWHTNGQTWIVWTDTQTRPATNGMSRFKNRDNKPGAGVIQPNQVITRRWPACAPGIEVIFITLTDGGHTWPDRNDNLGFDANAEVPRFFLRHTRP